MQGIAIDTCQARSCTCASAVRLSWQMSSWTTPISRIQIFDFNQPSNPRLEPTRR
jgi:hypothetical protein